MLSWRYNAQIKPDYKNDTFTPPPIDLNLSINILSQLEAWQ